MFFAPKVPPEKRSSSFARALHTLGLGTAGVLLFLIAVIGYLAHEFLFSTPQELYHRTWQAVPGFIYDPATLKDWDKWEHKFDSQIVTDEDAVKYANEMIESLKDPFTRLHSAQDVERLDQSSSGNFAGVGITLGMKMDDAGKPVLGADNQPLPASSEDGYPLIDRVFDGGPAATAGLQSGDALISANGTSLQNKSLTEVVSALKGEVGTPVKLEIRRNNVNQTLEIVRAVVHIPAVSTKRIGDVGYIRLESFEQEDTVSEMRKALASMNDAKSLVLDLRGNPGGRVDICIDLVSMFLEEGDVVKIRHRIPFAGHMVTTHTLTKTEMVVSETDESTGKTKVKRSKREAYAIGDKPLVILINGNSASASEMFSGALRDHGRATLVGKKTFGKGIGQMILPFVNGTALRVTTLRYFTPNGTWLGDGGTEHHGLDPHHVVTENPGMRMGTDSDNQLQKALELLNK